MTFSRIIVIKYVLICKMYLICLFLLLGIIKWSVGIMIDTSQHPKQLKWCQVWSLASRNIINKLQYTGQNTTSITTLLHKFTIRTGTCLLLFAKWRHSAHHKLSQLIWQQQIFIIKHMGQSLNFFSQKLLDGVICVPVHYI